MTAEIEKVVRRLAIVNKVTEMLEARKWLQSIRSSTNSLGSFEKRVGNVANILLALVKNNISLRPILLAGEDAGGISLKTLHPDIVWNLNSCKTDKDLEWLLQKLDETVMEEVSGYQGDYPLEFYKSYSFYRIIDAIQPLINASTQPFFSDSIKALVFLDDHSGYLGHYINISKVHIAKGEVIIPGVIAIALLREKHSATDLEINIWRAKGYITPLVCKFPDDYGYISIACHSYCGFEDSWFLQSELEEFNPTSQLRILSHDDLKKRIFWQERSSSISNILLSYIKEGKLRIHSKEEILAWTQESTGSFTNELDEWPPHPKLRELLKSGEYYLILAQIETIEKKVIKDTQDFIIHTPAKQPTKPLTYPRMVEKYFPILKQKLKNGEISIILKSDYVNAIFDFAKIAGEMDSKKPVDLIKRGISRFLSNVEFKDWISDYKPKPIRRRPKHL